MVLESKFMSPYTGYTLGNIITVGLGASNQVISHEYGHYMQSRMLGPFYSALVIPQSLTWAGGFGLGLFGDDYEKFYTEKWATNLGKKFFDK